MNNYVINPSQELIALGITNIFGPFFGAYPATGSFSRTAIKAKAGVRTPLAGLITGIVVLLALYALPAVFFYIPNASLAAVIIHAVRRAVAWALLTRDRCSTSSRRPTSSTVSGSSRRSSASSTSLASS